LLAYLDFKHADKAVEMLAAVIAGCRYITSVSVGGSYNPSLVSHIFHALGKSKGIKHLKLIIDRVQV